MLVLSQQRISFSVDGLVGPEFPRLSGRVGFTLLQFEIARSIRLWTCNALAFFVSVLDWRRSSSSKAATIGR